MFQIFIGVHRKKIGFWTRSIAKVPRGMQRPDILSDSEADLFFVAGHIEAIRGSCNCAVKVSFN